MPSCCVCAFVCDSQSVVRHCIKQRPFRLADVQLVGTVTALLPVSIDVVQRSSSRVETQIPPGSSWARDRAPEST